MINVARLMRSPYFARPFQVERQTGGYAEGAEGEYSETTATSNKVGIIQPAKREDQLAILPEGTRLGNVIVVFCAEELQIDNADGKRSDVVVWNGNPYRVIAAKNWADHGFWQVWAEGFVR